MKATYIAPTLVELGNAVAVVQSGGNTQFDDGGTRADC